MARRGGAPDGSIETLPSGLLRVRVYAGLDPVTKKRRYLRETVDSMAKAKAAKARLVNQVYEQRQPRSDITVSQAIQKWMEVVDHEESTRERNEQLIRLYVEPALGKRQLAKVDAELLEQLYARLMKCRQLCGGGRRKGHTCKPLAANTVRKIHFILSATFDRAVRWKYVGVNEVAMAEPPAFVRKKPDPPSAEEAAVLLNEASRDGEWALLLWLTMVIGWRRGEVCALRWTDVNLKRGTISIERSHWKRQEKSTKTGQERILALDEHTVGLLAAHKAQCESECASLGLSLAPDAFIFSNSPDRTVPLLPRGVSQRYRRLAQRAGLRSTRLHALRHYSATELIAARVDVRTVAGRLGHGSGGATTLRIYAGWVAEADRVAAETIASIVPRPNPAMRVPRDPYEKLAYELRTDILEGRLRPGDQLPTVIELTKTHNLARGTVVRAVALLKEQGLVDVGRGRRATVAAGAI